MRRPRTHIRQYGYDLAPFVIGAAVLALVAAPPAAAAIGDLTQLPGAAGCVTAGTSAVADCATGRVLVGASDVAVSPDGEHAYVTSAGDFQSDQGGVAVFDRDPVTGELTQLAGAAGCITDDGSSGACQDGTAVAHPSFVTVSPDGTNVYVVAGGSQESSIAIFDRDADTGALTQKGGIDACVSDGGTGGLCADARAMASPRRVAITTDGTSAYVGSFAVGGGGGVAVFDRDPDTGELAQKPGTEGCVTDDGSAGTCAQGRALTQAIAVTTSPDAANVYVVSYFNGIAIFDRDTATGALTQKPGAAGCITDSGSAGACADGRAMQLAQALTVSPDGANAYLAAAGALVVLDRDLVSGALAQKAGAEGCVASDADDGCSLWRGLATATDAGVAGDGQSVYTAAFDGLGSSPGIGVFDRHPLTGALTQRAGEAGCITSDGSLGECATGRGLMGIDRVALSPDATSVYGVAEQRPSTNNGSVTTFAREGGERPQTAISSGPAEGETVAATPTFEFVSSAAGSTFACAVDGAPAVTCTSPFGLPTLSAGMHTFSVVAIDPRGNADLTPASRGFATLPPEVSPAPAPVADGSAPPSPPALPSVASVARAAPLNVAAPAVAGRALVGRRVACATGRWTGSEPMSFAVRWLRNGRRVGSGTRYRVAAGDVARRLQCRVTASNEAGSAVATSAAVTPRPDLVLIRASGGLRVPPGVARARWCRGSLAVRLLKGSFVLGRATVRLNRRCRWSSTLRVDRARLGDARTLTLRERFNGNQYLRAGRRTSSCKLVRTSGGTTCRRS